MATRPVFACHDGVRCLRASTVALPIAFVIALLLPSSSMAVSVVGSDECAGTTAIAAVSFEETLNSSTATTGADDPLQSCTAGGPDRNAHSVWYQYVAPATGTLSIGAGTTPFPGDPPTIISVYRGGCGALQELACAEETRGDTAVDVRVLAETPYWVDVTNEAGATGGTLRVQFALAPDSPICPSGGGTFLKGSMNLVGLGPPTGNERLKITARMLLPMPLPQDTTGGLQLLVDGFAPDYIALVEWSARTLAIPAGGLGTGCDPRDGWTTSKNGASRRYRNHSDALPPKCLRGSANGLTEIRLLRKSPDWRVVDIKVRANNTTIGALPSFDDGRDASVWLSTTLGSTLGPGNADSCANMRRPLTCVRNGKRTAVTCTLH